MGVLAGVRAPFVVGALICALCPAQVSAQANSGGGQTASQETAKERDGQHDFDWDIGTWKLHMRRLLHPLTGSTTWVEYHGTDVVRKVWNGRANLGEVEI